jgi:hypothetical protein
VRFHIFRDPLLKAIPDEWSLESSAALK